MLKPKKPRLDIIRKHFETIKNCDTYDVLKSQFCCFQYLITDPDIYYYFHSWYGTYTRSFIAYYKCPVISDDHVKLLNKLSHDYDTGEPGIFELGDIESELDEDSKLSTFGEVLYGKNIMGTYKLHRDKITPSEIGEFTILPNYKNTIFLKPVIKIPRMMLPAAIAGLKPKMTATQLIEASRAKRYLKKHTEEA